MDRCAYYVSVKEAFECFLKSGMWQNCVSEDLPCSDVLTDVTDGQMFKSNDFLFKIHQV